MSREPIISLSNSGIAIIDFCAHEVERQMAGYGAVAKMVNAYQYAVSAEAQDIQFDALMIEDIGIYVEPFKNSKGFRTVPVFVGGNEKLRHDLVPRAVEQLAKAWWDGSYVGYADEEKVDRLVMDVLREGFESKSKMRRVSAMIAAQPSPTAADVWYKEFEDIHPFVDGNGRTGKILYNWINGTLDNPVMPFNWWGIGNP